jgi:transketolase
MSTDGSLRVGAVGTDERQRDGGAMRDEFVRVVSELLDEDPRTAVVLADISAAAFGPAERRHPDRVLNVGIREQLMLGVAGGLALTGLRPVAHSYAPFLVERAYEQVKLDLDHQGVGAVLVSVGASYDWAEGGRTHQSPGDVALLDTLAGWTVHVPGHPAEVGPLLRAAARHDDPVYIRLSTQHNAAPRSASGLTPVKPGRRATVVAVGPTLDAVLAATDGLDVCVVYTNTPRPFDGEALRALVWERDTADVALVEPYLAGTSAAVASRALAEVPHRLLALGVQRVELRAYGTAADHHRWHGLDPAGLRRSLQDWLGV